MAADLDTWIGAHRNQLNCSSSTIFAAARPPRDRLETELDVIWSARVAES
jgi:hypothetical protein